MRFLLPLLGCLVLQGQSPENVLKPENLGSVEGRVTSVSTGMPVAGVLVVLRGADWNHGSATESDGRFRIGGIPPGKYSALAHRDGFTLADDGTAAANPQGVSLTFSAGEKKLGLDFKLLSRGTITGLVLNPEKEPIPRVEVLALRRSYINGVKQYVEQEQTSSDASGRYYLEGLPDGAYFVSTRSAPPAKYVPTYYPTGTDLRSAVSLNVSPGSAVEGINLTPVKARLASLTGKVINQTGSDAPAILVLLPRASVTVGIRRQIRLLVSQEEFRFDDVLPGTYLLTAEIHASNPRLTNGQFGYEARRIVTIGEDPIDNVVLVVNKGIDIPGQLRVEDGKIQDLTALEVRLPVADLEGRTIGFPAKGPIDADGRFLVGSVSLDRHVVNVVGMPPGFYIKSFKSGGLDLLANELDLTPGIAAPLEIVLSAKAAGVTGTVTDRNDKPVHAATVALVPLNPALRNHSRFFPRAVTNDKGQFSMGNLNPGEYQLYAFEKVEEGAWIDAEFRAPFEDRATKVTLREAGAENVNLKLIPYK